MYNIGDLVGVPYSNPRGLNAAPDVTVNSIQTVTPNGYFDLYTYLVSANVALTIALPAVNIPYRPIYLVVRNTTGGALTTPPAYNGSYIFSNGSPPSSPGAGQRTIAVFYYDPTVAKYIHMFSNFAIGA